MSNYWCLVIMLIFLYGPDSYRRLKRLNEIIAAYRERHSGLSHERFDLSDDDQFLKFQNFVSSRSMFDPIRLAIVDGFEASTELGRTSKLTSLESKIKELKEILKAHSRDKELVIVVNTSKKPAAVFNPLLKPPTQVQEFKALQDKEINSFIGKMAIAHELTLDQSTIEFLAETFGSDTWGVATEVEKMALVANQVKTLRPKRKQANNYYQLINTLKWGRKAAERLVALEIILSDRRDEPARVFNSLAYHLRSQKEAVIFADYDVAVKSGKLEYEEILLDIALS